MHKGQECSCSVRERVLVTSLTRIFSRDLIELETKEKREYDISTMIVTENQRGKTPAFANGVVPFLVLEFSEPCRSSVDGCP